VQPGSTVPSTGESSSVVGAFGATDPFSAAELDVLATYSVARPSAWSLRRPALLVVDVVEAFVGPDVPVQEAQRTSPTVCGEHAWRALERIVPLVDAFRAAGAPVAYTTVAALPPAAGVAPRRPDGPLRPDVLVEPLRPTSDEPVLPKIAPSGFFGTPLRSWVAARGADQVVVVGGTTSGCVRATATDAYSYGLDVVVPADACFDRVLTSHVVTLRDLDAKYARVVTTDHVLDRLGER